MRRTVCLLLALGACVPDETGYGDPHSDDDLAPGGHQPPSDAEGALDRPVWYTAATTLGGSPTQVTIVALPGAFEGAAEVVLTVGGRSGRVAVAPVDGGFVTEVRAALRDVLRFAVDGDTRFTLTLDDDLTGVAPEVDRGDDAGEPGAGAPLELQDGRVAVGDGAIPGASPPYLAFVPESGDAARVLAGDVDVWIRAAEGDRLCLAALDLKGRAAPAGCAPLP